jgi:CHAT domain-containing protein
VHIQSQEPWVPWELLKPSGDDGAGNVVEAGFLCEDYEVTRWVPGIGYCHDLSMSNVGVVIPPDSGLAASIPERDQMLALATSQRQITPIQPEEVALRKALAEGTLDVIHFTGHGVAGRASADRAEIRLEAGSRLRPEDLSGVVANLGKRKPIVFLNACEIGRAGMGLTRPGGWPRGFLAAGAGAFIGPFWKVADASAATFAASFYEQLIGGKSVAAAARAARLAIQAASDPTWLAYSVYANCDARLS